MYIMYVDESGDSGLQNSPTSHFALSGIVVHESDWRAFINTLVQFKRSMRGVYGLPIRAEIHASEFMKSRVHGMAKHVRFAILRNFLDELAKIPSISVTNVIIDKTNKPANYDVFTTAWQYLFQRFENTLVNGNFPGAHVNDHGIVITDATNGTKLMRLMRRMAVFNHIPHMQHFGPGSRNIPITKVIEDPHGKDSAETLPIQAADVCAYFLMQHYRPNSYVRRKGATNYISRLRPILNTRARIAHPLGIVQI